MSARRSTIGRSSAAMAGGSIASRILGVVRQSLITYLIGQGLVGNAFQTANTLPNIIYVVIAGGVLNSVLVPQLVKAAKAQDGGRDYTDRLLTIAVGIFAVITILATVCAPLLVMVYAPALEDEALRLAVLFAVITVPQIFFYALYGVLGQVLNARGQFAMFGWAPAIANVVAILGLVGFMALAGDPLASGEISHPEAWTAGMIAWFAGTATLSIAAQALILLYPLWRSGFRWRPRFGLKGTGMGATSRVTGWAFASLLVSQIPYLAASQVMWDATGSDSRRLPGEPFVAGVASYSNALLVFLVPHGLIALSIFTALYPRISAAAHDRDLVALRRDYRRGLTVPAALTIPAATAMLVCTVPLISLLFRSRDPAEIPATAQVLEIMCLGVLPLGVDVLNQRMFYAFEDGRTAFVAQVVLSLTALGVTGLAAWFAEPEWVTPTIAGGLVVSNVIAALFGMVMVRRQIGALGGLQVLNSWLRMVLAATLAALPAWLVMRWVDAATASTGRFGAFVTLVASGLTLALVYLACAVLLRVRELDTYLDPILRRVRRARP